MKCIFQITVLLIVISNLIIITDGWLNHSLLGVVFDYIYDAIKKYPIQRRIPPSNSDDSIQYLLYTPKNKKEACRIQPSAKQFDKCSFNADYQTKILVHGFVEILAPENLFNVMKDAILEYGNYNVIVANWTLYNTMPYGKAYKYAKIVGEKMAEMMKFIKTHGKVSLKSLHCIGHSLGCHVCGVAGRNVKTLGRITGLDPDALSILKLLTPNIRLFYTDADFVDVMHTSDTFSASGLGYLDTVGHLDFYPNGGVDQPLCDVGNTYKVFKGRSVKIQTILDEGLCNHMIAVEYFIHSLKDDCIFAAVECKSYSDFEQDRCKSGIKVEMGFHTKKMKRIPAMTKFYLKTNDSPPFCKGKNNPS